MHEYERDPNGRLRPGPCASSCSDCKYFFEKSVPSSCTPTVIIEARGPLVSPPISSTSRTRERRKLASPICVNASANFSPSEDARNSETYAGDAARRPFPTRPPICRDPSKKNGTGTVKSRTSPAVGSRLSGLCLFRISALAGRIFRVCSRVFPKLMPSVSRRIRTRLPTCCRPDWGLSWPS